MIRARASAALLLAIGCTTPLAEGERLYREGDRHGALAAWRSVDPSDRGYEQVSARAQEVEQELTALVARYLEDARRLEAEDRLAESIIDFRLALELRPDDTASRSSACAPSTPSIRTSRPRSASCGQRSTASGTSGARATGPGSRARCRA
jgi:hypothetical protein